MNSLVTNRVGYCNSVPRVLLLQAVFLLFVNPASSQIRPTSPTQLSQIPLPEGAGKQIVQRACLLCHGYQLFTRVNFDREDWAQTITTMVGWGAPLKKEEIPVVIDYMATNFKSEGSGRGVVVPGPVEIAIQELDVPTPHSLPHDSLYSPRSGFVWYTGEAANVMGRFDPKSQQFREFHLKRPSSEPYTMVEDKQGNIWFTSYQGGFIGKLNQDTGDITEYPMPDPKFSLHDIAIDQKGILWFCVLEAKPPFSQDGSKIGRLNPKTGEIKFGNTPTRNAAPYGLAVNSKGVPFFTERDSPRLGSINPDTMEVTEYLLPNPGSGTRRLAIGPDDIVWYTDCLRGYLGRFDPKTGKFREWPSPSGPRSYPYGIAVVDNIVWYAEAESNPNMLVRFDPKTEKFQSWPVKAGGGIKHISHQPDGSLWLTRPRTNGIAYVKINQK